MFKPGQSGNPNGRPKGALDKRTREVAERLAKDGGISPLDVLVTIMRERYAFYQQEVAKPVQDRDPVALAKAAESAVFVAEKAAPFLHPKLAAIEHSGELQHSYVARTPAVAGSVDEWHKQYAPKTPQQLQ